MEAPATPSRTIRIYRRDRAWVIDSGGREQPYMRHLHMYLPPGARSTASQCSSIEDGLEHGLNPQMLSAALSAWYVEHPNASDGEIRVAEGVTELPDNNAYVALGDYIYHMIPVRQVKTGKAVQTMREKVKKDVEGLRRNLTQQASMEAQEIINQANVKASTILTEVERQRADVNACLRFPNWLRGMTVLQKGDSQYVLQSVGITFTGISYKDKQWDIKAERRTVMVDMWLPLNGDQERICVRAAPMLPHVNTGSSCLKLGEPVQPITGLDRLVAFRTQISRAMAVINLASLLCPDIAVWIPEIVKMLPDGVRKWLETYRTYDYQIRSAEAFAALPPIDRTEGGAETWSVL